ncbi:hypothetical protein DRQ18_03720 [bacterium]|nr:MAG: hypothetical protein DRQ18_03720 [bacterium]
MLCFLFFGSCKKKLPEEPAPEGNVSVSGEVKLPEGSSVEYGDLYVATLTDTSYVEENGTFATYQPDTGNLQLIMVMKRGEKKGEDTPLLFGYVSGNERTIEISSR